MNMDMYKYKMDTYINKQMDVAADINEDMNDLLQRMQTDIQTDIRTDHALQQQYVDEFTQQIESSLMQLNKLYNWYNNINDVEDKCNFIDFYNSLYKINEQTMKKHMDAIIKREPIKDEDADGYQ
jgi:hypothetical protein